jgi:predicted aspartyl protease
MNGTVAGLQARIGIILYPPRRGEIEIECVMNTGFEGFLTLPPAVVAEL